MKIEAHSLSCERDTETYWGCIGMKTPFTFPNTGQKMKDLRGENQVWRLFVCLFFKMISVREGYVVKNLSVWDFILNQLSVNKRGQ